MAKFYCQSGLFKTIIDTPDKDITLISKFISRLMRSEYTHSLLMTIGELGFENYPGSGHINISLVPFLRNMGVDLPPDNVLIENVRELLGLSKIDDSMAQWILYGVSLE
jgi:hypothetical protein